MSTWKTSKPKLKFRRAVPTCFAYESKKFPIPQSLHFLVSLPDANWQTDGINEINNHINKEREDVKQPEDKEKDSEKERERKHHTSKILHHLLGHSMARRKQNCYLLLLCLSVFFSLQFIWCLFFSACLSIRTWLWELLPQVLWSWKSLRDLSPNQTYWLQTRDGGTR